MALSDVYAFSNNGSIDVYWNRNADAANAINVRWSTDVGGIAGWTTLTAATAGTDTKNYTFSNDTTRTIYVQAQLANEGATWHAAADVAYAASTAFQDANGWTVDPLQSGQKRIFHSSAGSNASSGLTPVAAKVSWDDSGGTGSQGIFNFGDHLLYKRGETFVKRIFNRNFSGALFSSNATVVDAFGPPATARPSFTAGDGLTVIASNSTNNRPSWHIKNIDISMTIAARHADFLANGGLTGIDGIVLQPDGTGASSGGIDWLIEGVNIKYARFGMILTGSNGSNGGPSDNARVVGCSIRRSSVQFSFSYGPDAGSDQEPSGILTSAIDGLLIEDCTWYHNGFELTQETLDSGSGATVFYGPNSSASGGLHTTILTNTAGLVNARWNGTSITMTSGPNSGQTRSITVNTASSISHAAFASANNDGDTYTINALVDTGKSWGVNANQNRWVVVGSTWRKITDNTATALNIGISSGVMNGWNNGDGGSRPADTTAYTIPYSSNSQYRHNIYVQNTVSGLTVRNCIASHNQMMLRPGGTMDSCLMIGSSVPTGSKGAWVNAAGTVYTPQAIEYKDCFIDGTMEIDTRVTGGLPMQIGDSSLGYKLPSVAVRRTVFQGEPLTGLDSYFGGGQIQLLVNTGGSGGATDLTFEDNVALWHNGILNIQRPDLFTGAITVRRNCADSQTSGFGSVLLQSSVAWSPGGGQDFNNNKWWNFVAGTYGTFNSVSRTSAQLLSDTGDVTSTILGSAPTFTQKRRITDYDALSFVGGGGTFDHFLQQACLNRYGNWVRKFTAKSAISWMRQGYVNQVAALTALDAPFAPTIGVTSAPTNASLTVSWTDNALDETGFDLSYSTDQLNWTNIIGAAAANATTALVNGLAGGTTYYVRVRAVNAAGNSEWSAAASGTTSGSATTSHGGGDPWSWLVMGVSPHRTMPRPAT